jgi:6,7-dimethyl-8-ribityllumazine synthase
MPLFLALKTMSSLIKNLSDYDESLVPEGAGMRVGIVVSEWNREVTDKLAAGALSTLIKHGVKEEDIVVHHVPGSFELPLGAQFLANKVNVDAVICLGCVIQGETRHFDFICDAVAKGIIDLNIKHNIPFIFGVLTTNNQQQAIDRSGGKHGNKGDEAAIAAIKMIRLKHICE